MSKKIKPKKWIDLYPVGTKEGDEESRFFKILARNTKYEKNSHYNIEKYVKKTFFKYSSNLS
jgi:hypothetical protein